MRSRCRTATYSLPTNLTYIPIMWRSLQINRPAVPPFLSPPRCQFYAICPLRSSSQSIHNFRPSRTCSPSRPPAAISAVYGAVEQRPFTKLWRRVKLNIYTWLANFWKIRAAPRLACHGYVLMMYGDWYAMHTKPTKAPRDLAAK